ncbi:SrtB family sortase [Anaerobacillus alkaliphilus]|uniref:SrtB family sortase n=1 Tax=Anaerobacillus alkaliphilus TaxID=1548597 RepID=A0A4Q0VR70_9BACI|nr:class B sortase [Anaerobacillus alkaliphilus]RXI97880.1 SrtB family sortase [Anaerobacillus alkaliphilus]
MNASRIVIIFCLGIFLFSIYQIFDFLISSKKNQQIYAEIETEFRSENNAWERIASSESNDLELKATTEFPLILEQFIPLLELNKDTVGWITVPNSNVDYPVVQTNNNEFYLHHNFYGDQSIAGSIFMDFRNVGDGTDRHTILYGHNMRDGSMFQGLMKYKDEDFFLDQQIITFYSLYEEFHYEVFSVYVTDTDFNYIPTKFRSNRDYVDFLHELQKKSIFPNEITLSEEDRLLTLSTCSYEWDDARFVVHARKIAKEPN